MANDKITAGDAGKILDMTIWGVHRHDQRLKPQRLANGMRLYDRARVEQFARARSRSRKRRAA